MFFKRIKTILFLLVISLGSLNFQCNKNLDCRGNIYNFEIGIKAYPDRDSINVGDTIWLEVNDPAILKDVQTGMIIDYSNASNLGSAIGFQSFSSVSGQFTVEAAQKFNFSIEQGIETSNSYPTLYHEFLFAEYNGRYIFKLGVIPKEKGIYRLVFSNAASVYRKNDNCTKAFFTLNFKNTNQHYYFHPDFQGNPTSISGVYYFKVN